MTKKMEQRQKREGGRGSALHTLRFHEHSGIITGLVTQGKKGRKVKSKHSRCLIWKLNSNDDQESIVCFNIISFASLMFFTEGYLPSISGQAYR